MKAAYLKAKNQFEIREVEVREPEAGEVLVGVKACGFCGHDKILAGYAGEEWQPFGHEFAGVVEKVGHGVKNVKVGDRVVVETSIFDPVSDYARNGHPELDLSLIHICPASRRASHLLPGRALRAGAFL